MFTKRAMFFVLTTGIDLVTRLRIPLYSHSIPEKQSLYSMLGFQRSDLPFSVTWRTLAHYSSARILAQLRDAKTLIPVELLIMAKGKDAPNDSLTKLVDLYLSKKRVGTLVKEPHTGKLLAEWDELIAKAPTKPDLVDMAPAVSGFMAVKDAEELVCSDRFPGSDVLTAEFRK
jgi:nucleosome binding factor SPN SPT16 subunit